MSAWIIALMAILYVSLLFGIANWGERHADNRLTRKYSGLIYSLALAVYCTSWTYYGAVGSAVSGGWDYAPIFLGPILLFLFAQPFLRKLAAVAKKQNVTSVAHFISARYGKRKNIALLATLTCLVVVVPYIALQLQAVASSYQVLLGNPTGDGPVAWWQNSALLSAAAITLFSILFGTRTLHLTEQKPGIMLAIAFESVVKLLVLLLLAIAVYVFLWDPDESILAAFSEHALRPQVLANPSDLAGAELADALSTSSPSGGSFGLLEFATKTLLAMAAIFLLPRQFHVTFVENASVDHLRQARRWFSGYLLLITLAVIPIAVVGMQLFPLDLASADRFVLLIPSESGWDVLTILVFLGGFSAATSMVIIATLALSTMISNDVIMPSLLRGGQKQARSQDQFTQDYRLLILFVRRTVIVLVMALSYLYYTSFARHYELAETGLLAFALAIQLAPAVVGGLYWPRGNAYGVYSGLILGMALWFLTLMLPQLASSGAVTSTPLFAGLFGQSWLKPTALFGLELDTFSHGVLFSLGLNILAYIGVSLLTRVGLQDRLQAAAFVYPNLPLDQQEGLARRVRIQVADLQTLLERFVGPTRAAECLREYARATRQALDPDELPPTDLIEYVERELAGVVGASSAATLVNAILEQRQLGPEEVVTFFDDTSRAIQFSRKILVSTLEHLSPGVSVVDRDLNLVAWNRSYLALFRYPEGLIRVGLPVADIVRFNAERGLCGPGSIEEHVEKRITHMRNGTPHTFQRVMPDGRVVEMRGNPIPGGGFVTSFTDITEYVRSVEALAEAKQSLEDRVQERTQTISEMNNELLSEVKRRRETEQELLAAKAEAEAANASKTRFLALASHDILQPLNAARLFTAALASAHAPEQRDAMLGQLDQSLEATEELISTLLEIAKLDDGKLKPDIQRVPLADLLSQLGDQYGLIARQKGLKLKVQVPDYDVMSDATYLRRILQNLLSNAVKYSQTGRILLGCRRRGAQLLIQVWDTGPGIAAPDLARIFEDFYRIDATAKGQQGVGLGLGVVHRMAKLLGHELEVRSWPGKGSLFSIRLPLAPAVPAVPASAAPSAPPRPQGLPGLSIVCIDDDAANLAALKVLLCQWQIEPVECFYEAAAVLEYAHRHPAPDVLLIDYQLGRELNGLELYQSLKRHWGEVPGILVSASPEADLAARAKQQGLLFLPKPIKPAALRASLNHLKK